ncbi:phage tail protein [Fulvivirga ulvae]|uniref:phage tail protein n=1 Tax=Fulvivirga ulvae TaxID=2904245 RepID=UPI001F27E97B|nr:phage tail protein [Fulvivirga ulvae]UII31373.1 phage tail protein [Fulvivirga ulvae]
MEGLLDPALSHRFSVLFLRAGRLPYLGDIFFQRVSGLSSEVQLDTINEGGQNLHAYRVPGRIGYGNLILERGYTLLSPLRGEFLNTFSRFQFVPSQVIVTLMNGTGIPLGAWVFEKAYPVKWSIADLDAQDGKVVIDSMELAYTRYQAITL